MSDVFLSVALDVDRPVVERELRFTNYTNVVSGSASGMTWAVGRVDNCIFWGPAWDRGSRTRVLIGGRVALDETEWAAAERLPYEGGLAPRHLLKRWLDGGAAAVADYNGAALVVVIDERKREAHIWTDRLGFYPAFASTAHGQIVASHPDLIARVSAASGRPFAIDEATIAEFLRTGKSVPPFSYWREVRHLDSACRHHLAFDGSGFSTREKYWAPAFVDGEPPLSRGEFVSAFVDALRAATRRRSLSRLGRTVVMLSSGADSRGVLAALQSPEAAHCYTYYDEPNAELRGAQRIAALAGARHFPLQRGADYYVAHAPETVRLSGGMWSVDSGHHTGFAETICKTSNPGVILTGDFCDALFKGEVLNRRRRTFLGRNLPLFELSHYDHEYHFPFAPIAPSWLAKVDERLDLRFPAALRRDDPRKAEFARLAPLSRGGVASGHLALWRLAPFDFVVADKDVLDLYGRMSVADKLSGIAFGQAIARITGPRMARVLNNNFGAPVGTSEAGRVALFLAGVAVRKLKRAVGRPRRSDSVAGAGSWPELAKVALKSEAMRDWFSDIPRRHGEALLGYIHPAMREWSFEDYATRSTFQLYRLMTVDLWLRQCRHSGVAREGTAEAT
jgi:asparagine synthase (glutamine-hydrolysing)